MIRSRDGAQLQPGGEKDENGRSKVSAATRPVICSLTMTSRCKNKAPGGQTAIFKQLQLTLRPARRERRTGPVTAMGCFITGCCCVRSCCLSAVAFSDITAPDDELYYPSVSSQKVVRASRNRLCLQKKKDFGTI